MTSPTAPTPGGLETLGEDAWQRYVVRLCTEAWGFGAGRTEEVLSDIEALVSADALTDPAVELVLQRAGVSPAAAHHIAPSIRIAVTA